MADLYPVSESSVNRSAHLIVLHGLGGHYHHTWQSKKGDCDAWPWWVESEFADLGVWLVSYEAAVSLWRGHSMHLSDRARNIAARLLAEDALARGDISFIGHSLGGLVIKDVVRTLESQAHSKPDAAHFIKRLRRVAFLGTPHAGSDLGTIANLLRTIVRPSHATGGLKRNDPHLRDLNNWYREWALRHRPDHLVLVETRASKGLFVVKPDSADPGIGAIPVPVDADHSQVCKPPTKDSEIYKHIKRFLSAVTFVSNGDQSSRSTTSNAEVFVSGPHAAQKAKDAGDKAAAALHELTADTDERSVPRELVDREIQSRLQTLIRARPFGDFGAADHATSLARDVRSGMLSGGSAPLRAHTLAWCARVIAAGALDDAKKLLIAAHDINPCPAVAIGDAFVAAFENKFDEAFHRLSKLDDPSARSAALRVADMRERIDGAPKWLEASGFTFADVDADGRFTILRCLLLRNELEKALTFITELTDSDYSEMPAIAHLCGMINLATIVPQDLRDTVRQHLPIELKTFPLSADAPSIARLRTASAFFGQFAGMARHLKLKETASGAEDYELWLRCRDSITRDEALDQIREDLRSPRVSLRRVPFALSFGIKIDISAVERAISERVTYTGGGDPEAAVARFSLAFNQKGPAASAEYLKTHWDELTKIINARILTSFQVQFLAQSGQSSAAFDAIALAIEKEHLSIDEASRLRDIVAEASDPTNFDAKLRRQIENPSLPHLLDLVEHLESKHDWPRLTEYARQLFDQTGSLPDATRLARAMSHARHNGPLYEFLAASATIVEQSNELKELWAWALMHAGRFNDCKKLLEGPLSEIDTASTRALRISICVVSGDWEALPGILDFHWKKRGERDAKELLAYGDIALRISYSRAKDLIEEAGRRSNDDAKTLAGAYLLSERLGTQVSGASEWLQSAVKQSDDAGPLRQISLKDLLESQPKWEKRAADLWEKAQDGVLPQFALAKGLNRTLVDLHLRSAYSNEAEQDARRHRLILAYSGTRSAVEDLANRLIIDPTALLTLAYVDAIDPLLMSDIAIALPHRTFAWLWEDLNRLRHHQPRQLKDAAYLRDAAARGSIKTIPRQAERAGELRMLVGDDLADLLKHAGATTNTVVVRSCPVHRLSSLMEEEADLSAYRQVLVSCGSVARYLSAIGRITTEDFETAKLYLEAHEKEWQDSPEISNNTSLLLDDLSVSYLQTTGLLDELIKCGQPIYVSANLISEADELLVGEAVSSAVVGVSDALRKKLADAVASGRVTMASDFQAKDDEDSTSHPSVAVFRGAELVDGIVVDDRALNRHARLASGSDQIPVLTSFDILNQLERRGAISRSERYKRLAKLRASGFAFVPVTEDELLYHLRLAIVPEGHLVESAELRGIRRSLYIARMRGLPRLPAEAPWLDDLQRSVVGAIKSLWALDEPDEETAARAGWLLRLIDTRGWSASFKGSDGAQLASHGLGSQLMILLTPSPALSTAARERFGNWVKAVVLPLAKHDPRVFDWMRAHLARMLVALVSKELQDLDCEQR